MTIQYITARSMKMLAACLLITVALASCKKFVTLDNPPGQLTHGTVFGEDGSATAAVLDLYTDHLDYSQPTMCKTGGLAADELFTTDPYWTPFLNNEILPSVFVGGDTWAEEFGHIRACNLAIDGLSNSTTLTPSLKSQLIGEAKFLRAFAFFNLVNFYGDVPLTLSLDVVENATLPRAAVEKVWEQIFADLNDARELVSEDYVTQQRVRVNRSVVSALLARAYLYQEKWADAEAEATEIIDKDLYALEDPAIVFTPDSRETILQIYIDQGFNPIVFDFLPPAPGLAPTIYLREEFDEAFEDGDKRQSNWVGVDNDVHYVHKYKNQDFSSVEHCVLFRLAEIYLIRAEARAHLNNLTGANSAEADINAVRSRSGLNDVTVVDETFALIAIEQERKVELFGEYPHRWFDLKRTKGFLDPSKTRADEVLSIIKGASWQPTDKLFPITDDNMRLNRNLVQNDGYNN